MSYGRIYTASFGAVAVTVTQDLFELNAVATGIVVVHSIFVGQETDPGDAEAEMLRVMIQRSTGTSGSGGTTPTAAPHIFGSAAFAGTVEVNNTTVATTLTVIRQEVFNAQAGWFYSPTPEERITIPPSGRLVVTLPATQPADSLTMSGSITFEEID